MYLNKWSSVIACILISFGVAAQQGKTLKGRITEASSGKPLAGIQVTYKEVSAAITDSLGAFSLQVPDYSVSVTVQGMGFQPRLVSLKGRTDISLALYESKSAMPDTWNRLAETPDAYLQGKVSGLQAIRRSGTPGIGANLFLRGFSSLYATNQPLVVVDDVVFDLDAYGSSLIRDHYNNPLSYIDIRDIDNITVLKEGVSQYGTKAANGVILVTTSRAREEATKIDAALYGGMNFAPANIPVMNGADYRIFLSEMLQSQGLSASQMQARPYMNDETNPEYFKYHGEQNWQNKVLRNNSTYNGYLKITGGDNIAKYALSIGFMKDAGVITNNSLSRYNVRFNGDFNLSKRLTAATNLSFTYNEQTLRELGLTQSTNPIYSALVKAPFLQTNEVNEEGIASPTLAASDIFGVSNPVALVDNMIADNKSYRFMGGITFGYKLNRNITLTSTLAITMDKVRENFFVPGLGVVPDTLANAIAINRSGAQVLRLFSVFNDTRATYQRLFNNVHEFSVKLGMRFKNLSTEQDFVKGFNSATDKLTGVGFGINSLRQIGGSLGSSRWFNGYLAADYNYRGKYFLAMSMAVDGSSRFGKDASEGAVLKFGERSFPLMPSVEGAWVASSEEFMRNNKWIDLLKIRVSIGLTGNDDIGNFTALQTYTSQNLIGVQGLVRGSAGNSALQWETNTRLNGGFDLAVLNERLSFSFDAWQRKTDNMIIYEPAASASGFDYTVRNSGALKTTGWEATVQARVVNRNDLKWDVGFNITQYKSRITKLPVSNILTDFAGGTYLTQVGGAPNLFYGHVTNGIYTSETEATAAGMQSMTANGTLTPFHGGDVKFNNLNGNDKIIDMNDRTVIGDPNPDFYGGVNTNLIWKNWSLEGLFTFVQGNDVYNYTRRQLESMSGYANQTQAVQNRWKTDGQQASMPRASWGDPTGNSRFSDRWIEDGSYFRLRTLSVSYSFKLKPGALKYAMVYLTGNNLFTATKYKGYDPEFNISSSVFGQGVDAMLEPVYKSVQVGVKLGL